MMNVRTNIAEIINPIGYSIFKKDFHKSNYDFLMDMTRYIAKAGFDIKIGVARKEYSAFVGAMRILEASEDITTKGEIISSRMTCILNTEDFAGKKILIFDDTMVGGKGISRIIRGLLDIGVQQDKIFLFPLTACDELLAVDEKSGRPRIYFKDHGYRFANKNKGIDIEIYAPADANGEPVMPRFLPRSILSTLSSKFLSFIHVAGTSYFAYQASTIYDFEKITGLSGKSSEDVTVELCRTLFGERMYEAELTSVPKKYVRTFLKVFDFSESGYFFGMQVSFNFCLNEVLFKPILYLPPLYAEEVNKIYASLFDGTSLSIENIKFDIPDSASDEFKFKARESLYERKLRYLTHVISAYKINEFVSHMTDFWDYNRINGWELLFTRNTDNCEDLKINEKYKELFDALNNGNVDGVLESFRNTTFDESDILEILDENQKALLDENSIVFDDILGSMDETERNYYNAFAAVLNEKNSNAEKRLNPLPLILVCKFIMKKEKRDVLCDSDFIRLLNATEDGRLSASSYYFENESVTKKMIIHGTMCGELAIKSITSLLPSYFFYGIKRLYDFTVNHYNVEDLTENVRKKLSEKCHVKLTENRKKNYNDDSFKNLIRDIFINNERKNFGEYFDVPVKLLDKDEETPGADFFLEMYDNLSDIKSKSDSITLENLLDEL